MESKVIYINETIEKITGAAKVKESLLEHSLLKYLVASAFAGFFIGVGIIIAYTVGGISQAAGSGFTRIHTGIVFVVALTLVIFTGTELFTGNNMVMTVGWLNKGVSLKNMLKVWVFSYAGNLIGAIIVSALFVGAGLASGDTGQFFTNAAIGKASIPFAALFFRGVMCNILVCLAVLVCFRTQNDAAKVMIIFILLFTFITAGFEHSIANMTVYATSLLSSSITGVTLKMAVYNLAVATLGNIVGGALFVGGGFFFLKTKN